MRAFTGGYYRHLKAMYDYLGVQYQSQKFRFVFSKDRKHDQNSIALAPNRPYFMHASNSHDFPPPRPRGINPIPYSLEVIYAVIGFIWFSLCCLIVPASNPNENFDAWLRKIWMPRRFTAEYLLPLLAAIATCSHQEILDFPASDIVNYKKLITANKQYVVSGGVSQVEGILTQGSKLNMRASVSRIEPRGTGIELLATRWEEDGSSQETTHSFDQVIMAISPNIAAQLYEPLRKQLGSLPTRKVETIVHKIEELGDACPQDLDIISLRNSYITGGWTQASHIHSCGVAVTSCPTFDAQSDLVISRSIFTRTLRTPESRKLTEEIFGESIPAYPGPEKAKSWKNGDSGVWMVGAWCWDGMVLLEGAIVSAERTARAMGVEIPWQRNLE